MSYLFFICVFVFVCVRVCVYMHLRVMEHGGHQRKTCQNLFSIMWVQAMELGSSGLVPSVHL